MKAAVRIFALLVAVVGLVSASFSSTANRTLPTHVSIASTFPNPIGNLPAPLPCTSNGDCAAPAR